APVRAQIDLPPEGDIGRAAQSGQSQPQRRHRQARGPEGAPDHVPGRVGLRLEALLVQHDQAANADAVGALPIVSPLDGGRVRARRERVGYEVEPVRLGLLGLTEGTMGDDDGTWPRLDFSVDGQLNEGGRSLRVAEPLALEEGDDGPRLTSAEGKPLGRPWHVVEVR